MVKYENEKYDGDDDDVGLREGITKIMTKWSSR